jgi:hypothetical protein
MRLSVLPFNVEGVQVDEVARTAAAILDLRRCADLVASEVAP